MKKTTFVLAVCILLLISCKGEQGDPGEDGSSGGSNVYDANDHLIGELTLGSGVDLGILFSNDKVGIFNWSGYYTNGFCAATASGNCSAAATPTTGNMTYNFSATQATTSSYVFFTAASCSGTPYIHFRPVKGALFRTGATSFYSANGTETQSTGLSIASMYLYDKTNCTSSTSGTGVCCTGVVDSATGNPITTATGYALTDSYTFPSGISYPLTGPLYIK